MQEDTFSTTSVAIFLVTGRTDIRSIRAILMDRLGGRQTRQGDPI